MERELEFEAESLESSPVLLSTCAVFTFKFYLSKPHLLDPSGGLVSPGHWGSGSGATPAMLSSTGQWT